MNKYNHGFSIVPVLLIIVSIAVILTVGLRVFQSNKSNNANLQQTTKEQDEVTEQTAKKNTEVTRQFTCDDRKTEAEKAQKNLYCDPIYGFSFLYPIGWKAEESEYSKELKKKYEDSDYYEIEVASPGAGPVASQEEIDAAEEYYEKCALRSYTKGAKFELGFRDFSASSEDLEQRLKSGQMFFARDVKTTLIGDLTAYRYIGSPGECYNFIATSTEHNGKLYTFKYINDAEDSPNYQKYLQEYESIVKTLRPATN